MANSPSPTAAARMTMAEIGRRCKVSRTTVGRVLNNKLDKSFSVRPEVREQILKHAAELGFRPNLAAVSLTQARTGLIGVLGYNHRIRLSGVCLSSVRSLVETLRPHGMDVFVTFPAADHAVYDVPRWRVDGAVLLNASSPRECERLEEARIPYVVINGLAGPSGVSIVPDDRAAMFNVIDYLVDFGHRRIAYANSIHKDQLHHAGSERARRAAYVERLQHHGLAPVPGYDQVELTIPDVVDAALAGQATALVAYDHHVAIPISLLLNRRRIAVPEQMSLITFNDEYLMDELSPPVTVVSMPSEEMGQLAGQVLLDHLQHDRFEPGRVIKVETRLVVRESVSRIRSDAAPGSVMPSHS